jgi:hypothetical protein
VKKAFHLLRFAAVVAVFILIGRQIYSDWGSLAMRPPHFVFDTVAGALVAGLAGFAALVGIWLLLLRRGGYLNRPFFLFFVRIWLQTYLLRYIPGKVATIAERLRLSAKVGVPAGASIALMGWETLLLVVGAAVVVPLAIIIGGPATAAVSAYVLAAPLAALAMAFAAPPVLRLAMRIAWARRRFGSLASIDLRRRDIFLISLVAGLFWMLFGTSFFFVGSWFTPLSLADYPVVVSWFVISYLAGLAAVFVPAGLGVREAVLLIGLGSVMSGGQAAVVVVAARLWLTLLELVCVGLAWLVPYPDQGNVDGPSERTVPAKQSDPSAPLESKDG